jgi:hypothetical protein
MESSIEKSSPSWMQAHWKLALGAAIGLALCGTIAVFASLRNSDVVKLAMATADSNPVLAERLGRPLKTGWFITGSIQSTPGTGHAELAIPVSGPLGRGTIYAEGRKQAGIWRLEMLQFGNDGSGERLDLLVRDQAPSQTVFPQN